MSPRERKISVPPPGEEDPRSRRKLSDFTFVGIRRAKVRAKRPVSEQHDAPLAASYQVTGQ